MTKEKSMWDYFNLNSRARTGEEMAAISPAYISIIHQVVMYIGVIIGILFSTAVGQFQSGEEITLAVNTSKIIVSAVIGLMVVPQVYGKLKPDSPFIVQFGLFVQNGVFWSVAVDLIRKAL